MQVVAHQGQGAASGVTFRRTEILQGQRFLIKALQARKERMGIDQGDDVLLLARVVDSKAREGKERDAGDAVCLRVGCALWCLRVACAWWCA